MIIANENISVAEVRRLLRDPVNRTDNLLVGTALAKNVLNFGFAQSTPTAVTRIEGTEPLAKYGTAKYGKTQFPKLRYKDNFRFKFIVPDRKYNPVRFDTFDASTKLGENIPLSKFTGKYLNSYTGDDTRKSIAKHLYPQTFLLNGVRANTGRFSKASLSVAEGLFAPESNYTITEGNILELQTKGRAVVYDVSDGAFAFNIAKYWKDSMLFDELILSYDTVDPNVAYTAQIIVTMPELDDNYKGNFRRLVRTEFNYNIALRNGLAELVV